MIKSLAVALLAVTATGAWAVSPPDTPKHEQPRAKSSDMEAPANSAKDHHNHGNSATATAMANPGEGPSDRAMERRRQPARVIVLPTDQRRDRRGYTTPARGTVVQQHHTRTKVKTRQIAADARNQRVARPARVIINQPAMSPEDVRAQEIARFNQAGGAAVQNATGTVGQGQYNIENLSQVNIIERTVAK